MHSTTPLVIAVVCGILAFISQVLAVTMPGWLARKKDPTSYMEGIFYFCAGWNDCQSIIDAALKDHMRGMFITMWITQCIGLLLLVAGMFVIMVAACSKPNRRIMRNVFIYFNLSAGFIILIGVTSYVNVIDALQRFQQKQGIAAFHKYYYSLGLAVTALLLSWIGAIAAALYKTKDYERKLRRSAVTSPVYVSSKMRHGFSTNMPSLPRTSLSPDRRSYQTYY